MKSFYAGITATAGSPKHSPTIYYSQFLDSEHMLQMLGMETRSSKYFHGQEKCQQGKLTPVADIDRL